MKRGLRNGLVMMSAGLLALACSAIGHTGSGGATPAAASGSLCHAPTQPTNYQHVVWILMENKSFSDIIGNRSAPYINSLASQCALAPVQAAAHPSLPNYIALTSGSTHGIRDDKDPSAHPLPGPSIFSQLNGNWRSFAESMPGPCTKGNAGNYAVRHVPATYYTSISNLCPSHVLPYKGAPDISAAFTMITPNLIHDMHNGSNKQQEIRNGDSYLATLMPKLFASSTYRAGGTVIIIVWDEGSGSSNVVPGIIISPTTTPGRRGTTSDVGVLHLTEGLLHQPLL